MAFEDTKEDVNKASWLHGQKVYKLLKETFPEDSIRDYDIILNSLCGALLCLTYDSVPKDDRAIMPQLVYKILMSNIDQSDTYGDKESNET